MSERSHNDRRTGAIVSALHHWLILDAFFPNTAKKIIGQTHINTHINTQRKKSDSAKLKKNLLKFSCFNLHVGVHRGNRYKKRCIDHCGVCEFLQHQKLYLNVATS